MTDIVDSTRIKPLSHKARASIKATGWMTVWEGAIRSGKTVSSLIAWMLYISRSPENVFIMSGNTLGSIIRNTIVGDFGLLAMFPKAILTKDRSGTTIIRFGEKVIYLFGAHDDADYKRLKGLTAGGWYADEVATHPESFIVEALARTAVSRDRRIFWTLNPAVPNHYIYKTFLDVWEEQQVPGYLRFHFVLDDNLAMTKERKEELASQYHGRFKAMYILGLRVAAEGAVYDAFNSNMIYSKLPEDVTFSDQKYVACDYGTVNPCVFLECALGSDNKIYVLREYRWDSRKKMKQKTDAEYVTDMEKFIGAASECEHTIIVDPSASSFILALKLAGYSVLNGKNDVLDGIKRVSSLFAVNGIKIHESCTGLIGELESYAWDAKAALNGDERPLKTNDHAPDALRYYCMTALSMFDLASIGMKDEI
jgi:PBSX family phage terminase large subunit